MDKILTSLSELMKAVTLQRVLLVICLGVAALVLNLVYEGRGEIVKNVLVRNSEVGPEILRRLEPDSLSAINDFMVRHENIALLSVVGIDLKRNQRELSVRKFNDKILEGRLLSSPRYRNSSNLPVFITNDVDNNNEMISLIMGEYQCNPTAQSGLTKTFPEETAGLVLSCRVPIPPAWSVGTTGYIVVHMSTLLDKTGMERLKLDLMTLALYLYSTEKNA